MGIRQLTLRAANAAIVCFALLLPGLSFGQSTPGSSTAPETLSNKTVSCLPASGNTFTGLQTSTYINVLCIGAVANATGAPGVGTDNTSVFQTAMGTTGAHVFIPPGSYRWTTTINMASNVYVECAGRDTTSLDFDDATGVADGFTITNGSSSTQTIGQVTFENCGLYRAQAATAGAFIHATNTYSIFFKHNRFGYNGTLNGYNSVRIDCGPSGTETIEIYFNNNEFQGAQHDDVLENCDSGSGSSIADVFFFGRNYFSNAAYAAIDLEGNVGWNHIDANDFDNNLNGIIGVGGTQNTSAVLNINGNHFEGHAGKDWQLTNYNQINHYGNEYFDIGGLVCNDCFEVMGAGNQYTSTETITLNGVQKMSDTGSIFSTTTGSNGVVTINPGGGNVVSSYISFTSEHYPVGTAPFMYFGGSNYPATDVTLEVNQVNASCVAGTNYQASTLNVKCISPTNVNQNSILQVGTLNNSGSTGVEVQGGDPIQFDGASSGYIQFKTQSVAGTWNFNLPTTAGAPGSLLTSDGGGAGGGMTWTSLASPPAIGGTTPNAGTFTTLAANTKIVVNAGTSCTSAPFQASNNANTGIEFPTANQIGLCANGNVELIALGSGSNIAYNTWSFPQTTTGTNADFVCMNSSFQLTLQSSACTISSRRFKAHIVDFKGNALVGISALEVASYNMKASNGPNKDPNYYSRQSGLIAENVAKVFPKCAIYEDDMKTPKSYRQECIIAMLVKGEQELMEQNRLLKTELAEMRKPQTLEASAR